MNTTNFREQLEDRLIAFANGIIQLSENLNQKKSGQIISYQIVKSSISVALNYAEAHNAESRKDFIHKLRIALKELRETHIALRIVKNLKLNHRNSQVTRLLKENGELIGIFVQSINTAQKNAAK